MYRRCLRELFLDSYGGRGGHELWGDPDRRLIHRLKQRRTIPAFCRDLLADIAIAKSVFHLSGRRVKFWSEIVVEIRNRTQAWIESEADRYKQYR